MVSIESAYNSYNIGMPCATIKIGTETEWENKDDLTIESVEISSSIENESSTCKITLERLQVDYSEKGVLTAGNETDVVKQGEKITVKLGYYNSSGTRKVSEAFVGFIASVQLEYAGEGVCVVLECLDAKMWMMAGRKSDLKKGEKYSDIIKSVITTSYSSQVGTVTVKISQEPTLSRPIYQNDESDYQFLCRLAEETGCLFFMDLGEVNFISVGNCGGSDSLKLLPCQYLRSISWTSDVLGMSKQVKASGVNITNQETEVESKGITSNTSNIGSGSVPSKITKNVGSSTAKVKQLLNITTAAHASFAAQAAFTRQSINFIKCVATIYGYAELSLGMKVEVTNYGTNLNNKYILKGIEHKYKAKNSSFMTDLVLATDVCSSS